VALEALNITNVLREAIEALEKACGTDPSRNYILRTATTLGLKSVVMSLNMEDDYESFVWEHIP
jgi:hypothetical protein